MTCYIVLAAYCRSLCWFSRNSFWDFQKVDKFYFQGPYVSQPRSYLSEICQILYNNDTDQRVLIDKQDTLLLLR